MRNQALLLSAVGLAALACDGDGAGSSGPKLNASALDERYVDGEPACSADELGDEAPVVTGNALSIWPPNHKFHAFAVSDCASAVDACGEALNGEFLWGSSDEPVDDIGDGHHEPDILFGDCERVSVRSERQGPRDGRVYKLGVRFIDAAGNTTDGECAIVVDHDQRGVVASDSGESYRVTLDGAGGLPLCDGIDPPPAEDASVPPGDGDAGDEPGEPDASAGDADVPPPPAPDADIPEPI
jgi:hypothetical protein